MTDEPETSEPETSEQRSARRLQLEYQELELPHVRAQLQIDRWIESERALQAELDDWVEVAGFRERRTRYGFTKHWRDSDFDMR